MIPAVTPPPGANAVSFGHPTWRYGHSVVSAKIGFDQFQQALSRFHPSD
jgi:hypothetical protein